MQPGVCACACVFLPINAMHTNINNARQRRDARGAIETIVTTARSKPFDARTRLCVRSRCQKPAWCPVCLPIDITHARTHAHSMRNRYTIRCDTTTSIQQHGRVRNGIYAYLCVRLRSHVCASARVVLCKRIRVFCVCVVRCVCELAEPRSCVSERLQFVNYCTGCWAVHTF